MNKRTCRGKKTEGQRIYFKRLWLKMLFLWDRFPALSQEAQQTSGDFSQYTNNLSINSERKGRIPGASAL